MGMDQCFEDPILLDIYNPTATLRQRRDSETKHLINCSLVFDQYSGGYFFRNYSVLSLRLLLKRVSRTVTIMHPAPSKITSFVQFSTKLSAFSMITGMR